MFLHFLQSKEHKLAFLELAHLVANADGYVHKKEQGYLQSYMNEMEITPSEVTFSSEKQLSDIVAGLNDDHLKNIFFAEILLLIFADGDYNDDEKELTKDMKQQFGLSDETYETIKNWVIRMDQLKIEGLKLILNT
ncbi:TerB family tellurite resistance protein [Paenibacillus sp. LHD-38]|uniref:TerB family tellurite resistance protein n=1 Tax=Paenibacillus sp. LHD-38 TaxID=3072143 RepID=UPI00280ED4D6|nr:TerB family tellurite resistance protein [Paenibacillus sp. LHD-38]MDQ8733589.1 TerB family tellurite resistance protein [Paenibacillus sp. LHD-38]